MGLLLAVAILMSFYLTPVAMRLAWKHDAVSRPDGFRKKHSRPTPEWGGLAVSASVLAGIGLSFVLFPTFSAATPFVIALAFSVTILCIVGCYDDLFDMRPGVKLVGQLLAVVPILAVGAYVERLNFLGMTIELGWLGIPWTAAWIVLGINALNLIDGMDGLASSLGLTAAGVVAVLATLTGNTHVAVIAIVLVGAVGGFLAHNLPPARIYLGDCGSMVIGLVLASLAFQVSAQSGSSSILSMGAMLFVPLYDTALAIVRRSLSGAGIMAADRGHIHHRLLDRGFGVWGSLALLVALSLTAGSAACLAVLGGHEIWACAVLIMITLACAHLELFGHREWAMIRERLMWSRVRGKAPKYAPAPKRRLAREMASRPVNETGTRQRQLDGLLQTQTSLSKGINVRLAAAQSTQAATAGKRYVELLG